MLKGGRIVDPVADERHSFTLLLKLPHELRLLFRPHLGKDPLDRNTALPGEANRRQMVVASNEVNPQSLMAQALHDRGGAGLQGVSHCERPDEALVGGQAYTASAECIAPSTLIAFDGDHVEKLMADDTENAYRLYKNLALTLGTRLAIMNSQLPDNLSAGETISYGTGQVQESLETA